MSDYDCVYGDVRSGWFANTLRLRLAIRVLVCESHTGRSTGKVDGKHVRLLSKVKAERANFRIIHWNIIIRCTRLPITSIRVTVVRVLPSAYLNGLE